MSDCSANAWKVPSEREPGVIYQHGIYDAAMIAHVSAIEVEGVRFERVQTHTRLTDEDYSILLDELGVSERTCHNGVKPGRGVMPRLYCSNCGCYTTLNKPDNATSYSETFMDWPFYCGNCGAKVVGE